RGGDAKPEVSRRQLGRRLSRTAALGPRGAAAGVLVGALGGSPTEVARRRLGPARAAVYYRPAMPEELVEAAGGVVVRDDGRVAVVHRPRYDDWSLPKGKLDPGETFEVAAVREIAEETGVRARIVGELEPARYVDDRGRDKIVRWYRMAPDDDPGRFTPNDEVDELRWLHPEEAARLVSYEHDRALLRAIA